MAKITGIVPRKLQNFKIPLPTIARVEHFAAKHGLSKSQVVIDQLNKLPPARGKLPKPKKAAKKVAPKAKKKVVKKAVKKAVKASSLVTPMTKTKVDKAIRKVAKSKKAASVADTLFAAKPAVAVTQPLETPTIETTMFPPTPELPPQVTEVVENPPSAEVMAALTSGPVPAVAIEQLAATPPAYSYASELAATAIPAPPPMPPATEAEQVEAAVDVPAPAWPSEVSKEDLADLDKLLGA